MAEAGHRELPLSDGQLKPAAEVGKVLGTIESQPLEFWVAVDDEGYLQLDDVVAVTTQLPEALPDGRRQVDHYGVVDEVRSGYEGATYHSDVFRVESGLLPVGLGVSFCTPTIGRFEDVTLDRPTV